MKTKEEEEEREEEDEMGKRRKRERTLGRRREVGQEKNRRRKGMNRKKKKRRRCGAVEVRLSLSCILLCLPWCDDLTSRLSNVDTQTLSQLTNLALVNDFRVGVVVGVWMWSFQSYDSHLSWSRKGRAWNWSGV